MKNCDARCCRFRCKSCNSPFCFDHIGMHYRKGEFIPKGFGTGLYKVYCGLVEECETDESSSLDDTSESDMEDESESESSSDTW